ncbi:hypothetical protein BGZ75_008726, partial [Mortierella antarctica]
MGQPATSVSTPVEISASAQESQNYVKAVALVHDYGSLAPSQSLHKCQGEKHNLALAGSPHAAQPEPHETSAQSSTAWPVSIGALRRPADPQQLV